MSLQNGLMQMKSVRKSIWTAMFWYWAAVLRDATQQLRQRVRDRR